jgi:hypothetical protein
MLWWFPTPECLAKCAIKQRFDRNTIKIILKKKKIKIKIKKKSKSSQVAGVVVYSCRAVVSPTVQAV